MWSSTSLPVHSYNAFKWQYYDHTHHTYLVFVILKRPIIKSCQVQKYKFFNFFLRSLVILVAPSSVRPFSGSVIGTVKCDGLFERGEKTVQAKIIRFCVGGPS